MSRGQSQASRACGVGAGGGAMIVDAKQPQAVVDGGVACIRCTTLIDGKEGRQSGVL